MRSTRLAAGGVAATAQNALASLRESLRGRFERLYRARKAVANRAITATQKTTGPLKLSMTFHRQDWCPPGRGRSGQQRRSADALIRRTAQAVLAAEACFRPVRHARKPTQAAIKPGRPAPATGPGTGATMNQLPMGPRAVPRWDRKRGNRAGFRRGR